MFILHSNIMRFTKSIALLLFFIIISCDSKNVTGPQPGNSRIYERQWSPWTVTENGMPLDQPYMGGFNDPKISLVDFDRDGLVDLFVWQVYERYGGGLIYFHNTGTAASPIWTPVEDPFEGIDVGTWHTFCDIDADGDLDLFCDARNNFMKFYENTTQGGGGFPKVSSGGPIKGSLFKLVDSAFGNFIVGINNTPRFVDIDGDNDLDYFYGLVSGRLEYHRNIGDSANPVFTYVTSTYDDVCATCPDTVGPPMVSPPSGPAATGHGFSNITFVDIDSDFDNDLFWGDINNSNLYFFRNDGNPDSSDINLVTQGYLPVSTYGFNHAQFADLDGDSDLDMVVAVGQFSNIDNIIFYRNNGSKLSPSFIEVTKNLITQIDVGRQSLPAFGDLDNDGDIDMLLGCLLGDLVYYENIGDAANPAFNLVTTSFGSINVGGYSAPALVDWDGDGDLDLLIGNALGRIEFWRNDGDVTNFVPTLVTNQLAGIKVDQLAIPCPADMNNDGLIDLVVGEFDFNIYANVLLYQNTDTAGAPNPNLTLVTNRLVTREFRDFTIPVVYDWNDDGKKDLIIGGEFLGFELFINSAPNGQFPDSLSLNRSNEILPGDQAGENLRINFIDIDNDGDDDIFIGEKGGGVNFFRRLK